MASTDARPVPRKNTACRLYFTAYDSSGVRVTGFTSPDSEVSKDGKQSDGTTDGFSDCTNEATYIGRGRGYIELTATEMNADHVDFYFSCTEGTGEADLYPEEAGDIRTNVTQCNGSDVAAGAIPNAAAAASGGLLTRGTGTGQIDPSSGGVPITTAACLAIWNTLASAVSASTTAMGARLSALYNAALVAGGGLDVNPTSVRTALGLASANLDTQLATITTNTAAGYAAKVEYTVDEENEADEFTVQFFRNMTAVTSGVTVPTITVYNRAGTAVIDGESLTQIGSTGAFKYDATGDERIEAGDAALVEVSGTIDGSARIWREIVTRDAA